MDIIMILFGIAWAGALFGGFALGNYRENRTHRVPRPLRMFSSLMLVGAAWAWAINAPEAWATLALWVAAGMTFGLIGDLFMARLIIAGEHRVLGGIGAFGIGHVFYIVGILAHANQAALDDTGALLGGWLVWLIVGAGAWFLTVWRTAPTRTTLHIASLPYALLLASTAGLATGLALQSGGFALMALGAALFLLSDLILALELFNDLEFTGIGDVIWLTYGPGQMLIVYTGWLIA
ncbi:MAG: lysoplasmalogenase [Anaerolineaceae bacterium]|nr:MAG: lysoplasmalogenase [Anaerolineaceae bacterium]